MQQSNNHDNEPAITTPLEAAFIVNLTEPDAILLVEQYAREESDPALPLLVNDVVSGRRVFIRAHSIKPELSFRDISDFLSEVWF